MASASRLGRRALLLACSCSTAILRVAGSPSVASASPCPGDACTIDGAPDAALHLLQRSGLRVSGSRVDGADAQASRPGKWQIQEHPFYKAVLEKCQVDLDDKCPDVQRAKGNRRFNSVMDCLEKRRDALQPACRAAAFGGSALEPNSLIFKVVETVRYVDPNADEDYVPYAPYNVTYGYAEAPLFFNRPEASPIFRTWFGIRLARKQDQKKGVVFQHNGGPSPSISALEDVVISQRADMSDYMMDHYDWISIDLRGLGLSYLDLLEPQGLKWPDVAVQPDGTVRPEDWFRLRKSDTKAFDNVLDGGELCLEMDTAGWYVPGDWANKSQVFDYFDKKMNFTTSCTKMFRRTASLSTGSNKMYDLLQWMGTSANVRDLEWFRWALGAPKLTMLGYSYGTRFVGAYAATFPQHVVRAAVTGVMAPSVDSLQYAELDGGNFAQMLGFVVSQCEAAGASCTTNPFNESFSEPSRHFEGELKEAVTELFRRSTEDGGKWYEHECGEGLALELHSMVDTYLVDFVMDVGHRTYSSAGKQEDTWPWSFSQLPSGVFYALGNPCALATALGGPSSSPGSISIRDLISAIDMAGRFARGQVVQFVTSRAENRAMYPSFRYMRGNLENVYGWPQLPTPIAFADRDAQVLIVQNLYDGPTGMNEAQMFRARYTNSHMIVNLGGGHCVFSSEAEGMMFEFLLHGVVPPDGTITGQGDAVSIDFATGHAMFLRLLADNEGELLRPLPLAQPPPVAFFMKSSPARLASRRQRTASLLASLA